MKHLFTALKSQLSMNCLICAFEFTLLINEFNVKPILTTTFDNIVIIIQSNRVIISTT